MANLFNVAVATPEAQDHLTSLPAELQQRIVGYLLPAHDPDKWAREQSTGPSARSKLKNNHDIDALAAASKSLREQVMSWARIWLLKHRSLTKYEPSKYAAVEDKRNYIRGRHGLLTWVRRHCVYCGKKSVRSAIMMNGLNCCKECDDKEWPNKITKTEAKTKFNLKDHNLLPHQHPFYKLLTKYPGGLPKLRYGTYICMGTVTTLFMRDEVEALAKLAHGDLRAHLEKQQVERAELERKNHATEARMAFEAAEITMDAQTATATTEGTQQIAELLVAMEHQSPQAKRIMQMLSSAGASAANSLMLDGSSDNITPTAIVTGDTVEEYDQNEDDDVEEDADDNEDDYDADFRIGVDYDYMPETPTFLREAITFNEPDLDEWPTIFDDIDRNLADGILFPPTLADNPARKGRRLTEADAERLRAEFEGWD